MPLAIWDDEKRWESVYQVQGHLLAETLKAKLESEDIPAILRYESVGRVLGITVDGLGAVDIMVPEEFAERAREVLQDDESFSAAQDASQTGPAETQ